MEKDRKFRALAIAAICIAVVGVSVAYAALAASLSIEGTANVDTASSWAVAFGNPSTMTAPTGVTVDQQPKKETGDLKVTWGATFTAPGQQISFTVPVNNTGTIDAYLKAFTTDVTGAAETVTIAGESYDVFTYTIDVGSVKNATTINDFGSNTKLVAQTGTATVTVTVTFDAAKKLDAETLTSLNDKSATFTLAMEFGQAEGILGNLGAAA